MYRYIQVLAHMYMYRYMQIIVQVVHTDHDTDISRDGMLSGPNIEALKDYEIQSGLKIIASGGISSVKDLKKIQKLKKYGVDQVIVGKAIYEGKLNLKEILKC